MEYWETTLLERDLQNTLDFRLQPSLQHYTPPSLQLPTSIILDHSSKPGHSSMLMLSSRNMNNQRVFKLVAEHAENGCAVVADRAAVTRDHTDLLYD